MTGETTTRRFFVNNLGVPLNATPIEDDESSGCKLNVLAKLCSAVLENEEEKQESEPETVHAVIVKPKRRKVKELSLPSNAFNTSIFPPLNPNNAPQFILPPFNPSNLSQFPTHQYPHLVNSPYPQQGYPSIQSSLGISSPIFNPYQSKDNHRGYGYPYVSSSLGYDGCMTPPRSTDASLFSTPKLKGVEKLDKSEMIFHFGQVPSAPYFASTIERNDADVGKVVTVIDVDESIVE